MNLHIVPDSGFINSFHDNLAELGLLSNNKIVVRTNDAAPKVVKRDMPFAPLNSARFNDLAGDTWQYDNVFIHYFTPLLYRWVATRKFKQLHWMVWGGDLYNLPSLDKLCYAPSTLRFVNKNVDVKHWLYELKVRVTNGRYRRRAYAKVNNILSWMEAEYAFAKLHLPVHAQYRFFFYENNVPYAALDNVVDTPVAKKDGLPTLIVGNSGSPANNHLDAVQYLDDQRIQANLLLPVSYGGTEKYVRFLKNNIRYRHGTVEFVDRYMTFDEYLQLLSRADGLVMNTIRPQGYGNILMMMYMNKPVFFNANNISLSDLAAAGLKWHTLESLKNVDWSRHVEHNKNTVKEFFSHTRLLETYRALFG